MQLHSDSTTPPTHLVPPLHQPLPAALTLASLLHWHQSALSHWHLPLAELYWLLGHSMAPSDLTLAPQVPPVTPCLQVSASELFFITALPCFPHSLVQRWTGHISFSVQGSLVANQYSAVSCRAKGTRCNPAACSSPMAPICLHLISSFCVIPSVLL